MTRQTRPDLPEIEPALPELARLRELAHLELPSANVARAVLGRVQATLNANAPVARRQAPVRTWALLLGMVVAVPSALAATPVGATFVRQTVDWVSRTFALVDTSAAEQEPSSNVASSNVRSSSGVGVRGFDTSEPVPALSQRQVVSAPTPVVVFDDVHAPAARQATPPRPAAVYPTVRDTGTLNAERQLLERARVHLRAHDAQGALQLTAQHAALFPNGILIAERDSIINQARAIDVEAK